MKIQFSILLDYDINAIESACKIAQIHTKMTWISPTLVERLSCGKENKNKIAVNWFFKFLGSIMLGSEKKNQQLKYENRKSI